jgi:excisionase family DNA binding protein
MSKIIQIQVENFEEFKNEIIRGVVSQIKELAFNSQIKEVNPNELLSRANTAKLLTISLVKLWQLSKDKVIPSYKIGGKVLYRKSEVLEFVNLKSSQL